MDGLLNATTRQLCRYLFVNISLFKPNVRYYTTMTEQKRFSLRRQKQDPSCRLMMCLTDGSNNQVVNLTSGKPLLTIAPPITVQDLEEVVVSCQRYLKFKLSCQFIRYCTDWNNRLAVSSVFFCSFSTVGQTKMDRR